MASGVLTIAPPSGELISHSALPRDNSVTGWGGDTRATQFLPPGFPLAARGACAWGMSRLPKPEDYILSMSGTDIAEMEAAMVSFKDLGLDGDCVERDNFPLPNLGPRLRACAEDLHNGRGFFVLSGLDPNRCSPDSVLMFLGLASHVADLRGCQDKAGNMLTHVTEHPSSSVPRCKRRLVETNAPLKFHNDHLCDIIALHARQTAAEGGEILLAPVSAVYNDLVLQRPDIIRLGSKSSWPFHNPQGDPAYVKRPLLFYEGGRIVMNLSPDRIRPPAEYLEQAGLPGASPAQIDALDTIESHAQRHHIRLRLHPGDLLFFNNLSLLHSRKRYRDAPGQSRHLVRLWLRNSELGWKIPKPLLPEWRRVFEHDVEKHYQIEPTPVVKTPIYRFPTH